MASIFLSARARAERFLPQAEHPQLPGQFLVRDFVTPAEEAALLQLLDDRETEPPWKEATFNGPHRGRRWGVGTKLGCGGRSAQTPVAPHTV